MALTKERKGEIAIIFLKHIISEKGIQLKPLGETIKEIKQKPKELGISESRIDEAVEFIEGLIREIVDEFFSKSL